MQSIGTPFQQLHGNAATVSHKPAHVDRAGAARVQQPAATGKGPQPGVVAMLLVSTFSGLAVLMIAARRFAHYVPH